MTCRAPTLTADDERACAGVMESCPRLSPRWTRARDRLVLSAQGVADRVARKYAQSRGADVNELRSAALEGVLRAAEKFDPSRARFAAAARIYAAKYVRNAMRQASTVRASDRAITERGRVERAEARYRARWGEAAPDWWVADEAEVSVERLRDLRTISPAVSLDAVRSESGLTLGDLLTDEPQPSPSLIAARASTVRRLAKCLPPRYQHALRCVEGLGVEAVPTVAEFIRDHCERDPARARSFAREARAHLAELVEAMLAGERAQAVEACGV